jgi:UDPglucose--hexose-1-phosphate uridylyltransferase
VIATERSRRPTDFAKKERQKTKKGVCPLCPGNEHMTPPAVLVYLKSDGSIEKAKDKNGFRYKDWLVRCVPNLYPAFTPPYGKAAKIEIMRDEDLAKAVGHHEVLVESPIHNDHPANAEISQLMYVINAYIDRLDELSSKSYVKYVSIFRNYGLEAGASLSHAHSQIIATPFIPKTVEEEFKTSEKLYEKNRKCILCDILEKELDGPRLIHENQYYVVFAPWASVHPLEFWILPKKHEITMLEMSKTEMRKFAETLKACMSGVKKLLNDPPYNFGFHLSIDKDSRKYYHWHLEIYPKLAIWAGFEKSTGIYINTVAPEIAAESLREAIAQ